MKKFEYKKITQDTDVFESLQKERLAALGEAGWELVSVCMDRKHVVMIMYFKREIQQ